MINKNGTKIKLAIVCILLIIVTILILIKSSSQMNKIAQVNKIIIKPAKIGAGTIQLEGSGDLFDMGRGEAGKVANVEGHDMFCVERGTNFAKGCKSGLKAEDVTKLNNKKFQVHTCPHVKEGEGIYKKNPYDPPITSMPVLVEAATIDIPDDVAYIMSQPGYDYNNSESRKTAQNAIAENSAYKKGVDNIMNNYSANPPWDFPEDTSSSTDVELGELEPGTHKKIVGLSTESKNYETFKETVETTHGSGGLKVVDINENNKNIEAWVNQREGTITLRTILY